MSTDITVSLDEFIVFNTPNHSCDNRHYIGSDRLKTLAYAYLIGDNKIYQRHRSYWILKAVLVNDKLLVDYSFEDIDLLEEQILILSAFDRVVTIKWETLWEYFNVADIEELNKISRQLVDRRLDEIANPLKVFYNNAIDDGETQLDYAGWEVEMNELFTKWKVCEEARLRDGYTLGEIVDYLNSKDLKWFIREYYNNSINFYTPQEVQSNTVVEEELYQYALQAIADISGLETNEFLPLSTTSLNDYLDWIRAITNFPEDGAVSYGTIVYNHHYGSQQTTEIIDYPF